MSQDATLLIEPRERTIGALAVRRLLPFRRRRSVGPFVFFDHMGPVDFAPGRGLDVLPHPHIGLATLTYLFDGAITHRDSLGSEQVIRPGDVNWMIAGRGIAHSERTPDDVRSVGGAVEGLQIWVALPQAEEERAPSFEHHNVAALPAWDEGGVRLRLVAGAAFGRQAPVTVLSQMFYLDAAFPAGMALTLPPELGQRAFYLAEGGVFVDDTDVAAGQMLVLEDGGPVTLQAGPASRLILFGGAALDGPRHMWWNFVSSSKDRIERAKTDWARGHFQGVPGETEFVPLPES